MLLEPRCSIPQYLIHQNQRAVNLKRFFYIMVFFCCEGNLL